MKDCGSNVVVECAQDCPKKVSSPKGLLQSFVRKNAPGVTLKSLASTNDVLYHGVSWANDNKAEVAPGGQFRMMVENGMTATVATRLVPQRKKKTLGLFGWSEGGWKDNGSAKGGYSQLVAGKGKTDPARGQSTRVWRNFANQGTADSGWYCMKTVAGKCVEYWRDRNYMSVELVSTIYSAPMSAYGVTKVVDTIIQDYPESRFPDTAETVAYNPNGAGMSPYGVSMPTISKSKEFFPKQSYYGSHPDCKKTTNCAGWFNKPCWNGRLNRCGCCGRLGLFTL